MIVGIWIFDLIFTWYVFYAQISYSFFFIVFFSFLERKIISKNFAWKKSNLFAHLGEFYSTNKVIPSTARALLTIKNKLATNKILGCLLGQRPSTLYLLQSCNNYLFPSQTFLKLHFITYCGIKLLNATAKNCTFSESKRLMRWNGLCRT